MQARSGIENVETTPIYWPRHYYCWHYHDIEGEAITLILLPTLRLAPHYAIIKKDEMSLKKIIAITITAPLITRYIKALATLGYRRHGQASTPAVVGH